MCENVLDQLLLANISSILPDTHTHLQAHALSSSSRCSMHTHPSAPLQRPYSQLSQSRKIKDGGAWSTWWTWHLVLAFALLTAPGSCHPDAILPAFITCWKARDVTGRASWRVTALINPMWQLPDAPSGSSPPSLSRFHIPVSQGPITSMIYILGYSVNSAKHSWTKT